MITTPLEMAQTFIGVKEVKGMIDNPMILAFLKADDPWPEHDEVPWCSGFMNFICKCCATRRSRSLAAISWLNIGYVILDIKECVAGFDIVILSREGGNHVGFYIKHDDTHVWLLGGNQGDQVSIAAFPRTRIKGIRRLER